MVRIVVYNGSFGGFLTAVFEVYEYKWNDVNIVKQSAYNRSVFGQDHTVHTNPEKAVRVWKGLITYGTKQAAESLYHAWLSEIPNIEKDILQYIQYLFDKKVPVNSDFSHAAILKIAQVTKKIYRERHRMEAFIRFQLTKDGLYYAVAEPDFDVLPLLVTHFTNRFADQRWLIYDAKRRYGIYYNLEMVETVEIAFAEDVSAGQVQMVFDEEEPIYQSLWQNYFNSVNIKARKNTRLHIQHMPKRYWKYLPEKKPFEK